MPRAQASSQQCFLPERGDSRKFGSALALNDDYLAVGDSEANRVVLYSRQANGSWSKTGEILPPSDSAAAKVGEGFGYDLALDGSLLVIGAYTAKNKPASQEGFQWTSQLGVSYSGGVYRVLLNSPGKVKRIDKLAEGQFAGISVATGNGKIAFTIRQGSEHGRIYNRIGLWSDDVEEIRAIQSVEGNVGVRLGVDIHKDFLLVGARFKNALASGSRRLLAGALLFNLKAPDSAPRRFAIPDAQIGSVVAISDEFVMVSSRGTAGLASALPEKTLIVNIKDGLTTVLNGAGHLSLDGNLLVRVYRGSNDGELPAKLELFDLSDAAEPSLIARRWGRYRAEIHNGMLTTVQETRFGSRLCIEPALP